MSGYNKTDRVVHSLLEKKGHFTSLVMKDGRVLEGSALAAFMKDIKQEHKPNEEFPQKVVCEMNIASLFRPPPPAAGPKGALSPPELSFVYLDVGAWWARPTRSGVRRRRRTAPTSASRTGSATSGWCAGRS
jgi:hypothetical protein